MTQRSIALVASISRSFNLGQNSSFGCFLPVISQTKGSHAINEECGKVDVPAVLTGRVVIGEGVVVVVETFTWNKRREVMDLSGVSSSAPHTSSLVGYLKSFRNLLSLNEWI